MLAEGNCQGFYRLTRTELVMIRKLCNPSSKMLGLTSGLGLLYMESAHQTLRVKIK